MPLLDFLRQTITYAIRALRREPGLASGIIATFAIAIGANAAMFGLVGRLLLGAPPGVRDAERVARLTLRFTMDDGEQYAASTTSYPAFRAVRAIDEMFSAVAAVRTDTFTVGQGAERDEVAAITASGDYFTVLGTRPHRGRFFSAADDELPLGSPVVVLSHRFWQRRFGGDAAVLGTTIVLDDRPFTIVGIAPPEFTGDRLAPVDVFVPLTAALQDVSARWFVDSRLNVVWVIARLRDEVDFAAAQQAATTALRAIMEEDPRRVTLSGAALESLLPSRAARDTVQGRTAIWLTGVAVVVLLIATANVATLLLLRSLRRRREIAVRIALGASRARLTAQLLAESLALALAGSVVGLLVARWLSAIIRATLMPDLAASERLVDPTVLTLTVVMACAAGVLAGGVPLLQAGRRDVVSSLRAGAERGSPTASPLRAVLVAVQVALCVVLLVGAGVFLRSLQRVRAQDLGFSTTRLLYVTLDVHASLPGAARDQLHRDAAHRLTTLTGVSGATVVQATPFGNFHVPPISVPGMSEPPRVGQQLPYMYGATPDYLRMIDVRLREGRRFTEHDTRTSPLVVLVNETMARRVWPTGSAIGKCIRVGHDPTQPPSPNASTALPCREVVGVVRDSRARSIRPDGHEAAFMQFYVPFEQLPPFPFDDVPFVNGLIVETAGNPGEMAGPVQRLIQRTSATPLYARVRPYQYLLDPQIRPWRVGATVFSAFAALALGIASVGLFGVVAYLVTQRTREIGVRLALGGSRSRIGRVVVLDSLRLVGVGLVAGLGIAFAAAPFVQPLLFHTSARDPAVVTLAAIALLTVAAGAAAVPAWRATRVSPLVALGAE
ncbi:MAG: permease [Geminicoccaceae bacterium]|nr:permease [Geminicoccaceae bacterium]